MTERIEESIPVCNCTDVPFAAFGGEPHRHLGYLSSDEKRLTPTNRAALRKAQREHRRRS